MKRFCSFYMTKKMKKVRVILTGGFLGAGKTTSILKLASLLQQRGIKAGIITNDQGSKLVDGSLVKAKGIPGTEVSGGCFCCHFDEFLRGMNTLIEENDPDVLLAEPVGSCTDLVATVLLPLQKYYPEKFILTPFTVITDGTLLYSSLVSNAFPFSEDILYLFKMQIEESDILLINKTDVMEEDQKVWLLQTLAERYLGKVLLPVSALLGTGFEQWASYVLEGESHSIPLQSIDYERYGLAESLLGWYNSQLSFKRSMLFDPNDLIEELLGKIASSIKKSYGSIAHLKVISDGSGGIIKASVTGSDAKITFSQNAYDLTREMNLLINARVEINPDILKEIIHNVVTECCHKWGLHVTYGYEECFKPSYPNPTYRGV